MIDRTDRSDHMIRTVLALRCGVCAGETDVRDQRIPRACPRCGAAWLDGGQRINGSHELVADRRCKRCGYQDRVSVKAPAPPKCPGCEAPWTVAGWWRPV